MVSALSSPMPSHSKEEKEIRIIEVEFIGELPKDEHGHPLGFRRGISCYPSLGDIVFRASKMELEKAYACDAETAIRVGHITQDSTIPAMIKIDEMLGKHFAILGTTGTGKSCTVALILRRILEKNPQAHILLLDVHREYANAFQEYAEVITPDNMNLPFWLLNFDEIVEILIGQHANREADTEVLRELIPLAKMRYMNNQRRDRNGITRGREAADPTNIGVDTPIPYRTSDLTGILDEYIGKLELRGELAPYKRLKARIETITRDPRYAFMFGSLDRAGHDGPGARPPVPHSGCRQAHRHSRTGRPALRDHQRRGLRAGPPRLRFRRVECRPDPDHLRMRGSPPLRAHRQDARLRADQARHQPHRQGRPQVWRVALHRDAAPGRTRPDHPVPVQHHLLDAPHQRARPGNPPRRHLGRRRQPARIHAHHGHGRSHHLRRRRRASHPHQVRHAPGR